MSTNLTYRDPDGERRELKGCTLTQDTVGRFWLWSENLECNLAYKAKTKEDCLLSAIDSLLFTINLRDERIRALKRIADLAERFADAVKSDVIEED